VLEPYPNPTEVQGHHPNNLFVFGSMYNCPNASELSSPREKVLRLLEDFVPLTTSDELASAGGPVDRSCNDTLPYGRVLRHV
jgi:hypothetical protein